MARPRVFVSSTYYDLKHIRAAIERFIESMGFEAVLSEKGSIAYAPDVPLDESCYREVRNADILVLIVGGRYGSERSGNESQIPKGFFDRYDSITKAEYRSAVERDIPIYIFVERAVHAEYQTFKKNKGLTSIAYAHVDSVNIFLLLEDVEAQPRNNPIKDFDRYEEIESWLRDQWAGLFKELLGKAAEQKQIVGIQREIEKLTATSSALQSYLEELVTTALPKQATGLIEKERAKLDEARKEIGLRSNEFVKWATGRTEIPFNTVVESLRKASSFKELADLLVENAPSKDPPGRLHDVVLDNPRAQADVNAARALIGVAVLPVTATRPIITLKHPPRAHASKKQKSAAKSAG